MVLIHLRVEGIDLPLPEGVVQGVVDRRRRDAHARRRCSVDGQRGRQPVRLLIRHYIRHLRKRLEFREHIVDHSVQLSRVRVFERVLILGATDTIIDCQILHRPHVEPDALDLRKLRPEAADQLRGGEPAPRERLEVDLNAAAVESRIGSVGPDEGGDALHGRVREQHSRQRLLPLYHRFEGDRPGSLRDALDDSRVLSRKETLRNVDVEDAR